MKTKTREAFFTFASKNRHFLIMIYWLFYLPWFDYLERTVTTHFHVIHMAVDDYIPFCEYFIVPYFLWFGYVAWGILYFYIKDREEYLKLCAVLFTGMTIFLIISTVYPNGHYLRPAVYERDNIFVSLVRWLHATDTPTNLFPSIHVYNSIAVNAAVWHSSRFKKNRIVRFGSAALMVSIILATMFLKQHSVFDVVTGIALAVFLYSIVYNTNWAQVFERLQRQKVRRRIS